MAATVEEVTAAVTEFVASTETVGDGGYRDRGDNGGSGDDVNKKSSGGEGGL